MIATTITAIARMIVSSRAIFASWRQVDEPEVREANRERCVIYFTLRIIVILMETIKDLDNQHGSDGLTQKQRETTPLVRKRRVRIARKFRRSCSVLRISPRSPEPCCRL